jgi:hypothetical protein
VTLTGSTFAQRHPQQHTAFAVSITIAWSLLARQEDVALPPCSSASLLCSATDKLVYKPMVIARALERLPVVMA